jgi:hypothetical protein
MPLLAINLSDTLSDQIKVLVGKGLYRSFESFLEIAAFNQLAMERGASPAEIVEHGHRKMSESASSPDNSARKAQKTKVNQDQVVKVSRSVTNRSVAEPVARLTPSDEATLTESDYDNVFKHLALVERTDAPTPVSQAADKWVQERLFGQVNRLLPLKLACRWLVNSAISEGRWPRYEIISDKLADDAGTIGTLLEKWDTDNERKRDEMLSTGLPRRGNSASRDRFLSQFVARVTRSGGIYPAAICQYKLARFEDSAIALTEQGLAFSQLNNPILDKRDTKATSTLAADESTFLAEHIRGWVPVERDDMRVILRAVADGKNTPTDLTRTIRSHFPPEWSDSVFQTHISGLIARLGELRFLKRVWQGRNVNYEIGEQKQIDAFMRN